MNSQQENSVRRNLVRKILSKPKGDPKNLTEQGERGVLSEKNLTQIANGTGGSDPDQEMQSISGQRDPRSSDGSATDRRDPLRVLNEEYRQREAQQTPNRTRRVQFSEQLEIDMTKISQTPTNPSISILRMRDRTRKPTPAKVRRVGTSNPRDPPPSSSEKPPRPSQKPLKPDQRRDVKVHMSTPASLDPPAHRSKKPLFSPRGKQPSNILASLERLEKKHRMAEQQQIPRDDKKSISPGIQDRNTPSSRIISTPKDLSGPDTTSRGVLNNVEFQGNHPPRVYAPSTDNMGVPNLYPNPWRGDSGSLSTLSSKSQRDTKASKEDSSKKYGHTVPKEHNQSGDGYPFATAAAIPEGWMLQYNGEKRPSELMPKANNYNSEQTLKKQVGYLHLEDEVGGDNGTELILLPSVPQRIEISASTDFSALTETPRAKNVVRGTLPEPKASALASNLPFHDLPVIPVNYEKASKYLKNGTGTDEIHDRGFKPYYKATKSDTRDTEKTNEYDDEILIPKRTSTDKGSLQLALMLFCLVGFCLLVGMPIYFKMVIFSDSEKIQTVEESECVNSPAEGLAFSERYTTIRKHLIITAAGDATTLDETGTPQRKALCWLADFDERHLDIRRDGISAIVQRYSLGVLYYSMSNEYTDDHNSLYNTDFLSFSNECEWGVIRCSQPDNVTALLLADKSLSGSLPTEIGNLPNLCT